MAGYLKIVLSFTAHYGILCLMHRGITILLSFAILFSSADDLRAEIKSRVLPDGTVLYYNRPEKRNRAIPGPCRKKTPWDTLIDRYSREEKIDPCLVRCVIQVESAFQPDAVSVSGAMGLMQLMQATADMYDVTDPLDPEENLRAGIKHLAWLLRYFRGDVPLALAAYHAGLGRVAKRKRIPPIQSTIRYVNRVMKFYRGSSGHSEKVKRLYQKIDRDGDIIIYSR